VNALPEEVTYKNHTIKLNSQTNPDRTKWEPLAMVWEEVTDKRIGYPISCGEWLDTEALANARALERAKAWIDAKVL